MIGSRRERLDHNHRSELAIRRAVIEVEVLPKDEKLDEALELMRKAKSLVADYFDNHLNPQSWNNSTT